MGDVFGEELTDQQLGSLFQTKMAAEGVKASLQNKQRKVLVSGKPIVSKPVAFDKPFEPGSREAVNATKNEIMRLKNVIGKINRRVSPNGKTQDVENVVK